MRRLIRERIISVIGAPVEGHVHGDDAADIGQASGRLALTTDSFVVSPLFFPGGDIGSLAVYGTVNDLAVAGARPRWLTLSLIIEEGLPLATLDRVLASVAKSARRCGVQIVTGDTKVVPVGAADQLFINTSGVGTFDDPPPSGPSAISDQDRILVSGPIGKHGIAVMCERQQLGFSPPPESDSAPLSAVTASLQKTLGSNLIAMRDATRGGLSATLHEWAAACGKTIQLDESKLPVTAEVRGACELLGLDPLYVANEGTFLAVVRPKSVDQAIEVLRRHAFSEQACQIGEVIGPGNTSDAIKSPVIIKRMLGRLHPVDEPEGAPLPRIC